MTRAVVCDAGPLIHLDQLACLDLLSGFDAVRVPEVVWGGVLRYRPGALPQSYLPAPISPVPLDVSTLAVSRAFSLDAGEAACLAQLSRETEPIFLTDDAAARVAAGHMGFEVHGTLGILVRAVRRKQRSPIQVLEVLESIRARSTLYIDPRLLASVRQQLSRDWGLSP